MQIGTQLSATTAEAFASKYLAAAYDASGTIVKASDPSISGGEQFAGIAQISAASGDRISLVKFGRSKAVAGAALTRGTHGPLMIDSGAAGRLVPATAGNVVVAFWHCDGDSKADGDEIDVFVIGGMPYTLDTDT
jgi:hypothetical protein